MSFFGRFFGASGSGTDEMSRNEAKLLALADGLRRITGVEAIDICEIPFESMVHAGRKTMFLWINVGPLPYGLDDDARQIWEACRDISAKMLAWIGRQSALAGREMTISILIGPGRQEGRALRGWLQVPVWLGAENEPPLRLRGVDSNVRGIRKLLEQRPELRAPFPH